LRFEGRSQRFPERPKAAARLDQGAKFFAGDSQGNMAEPALAGEQEAIGGEMRECGIESFADYVHAFDCVAALVDYAEG
jgi:hypothetical protein